MPGGPAFGIDEDWNIEAGGVGDQLSMKVWRAADLEPESPQWTFTDRSLSTGDFGPFTGIDNRFRRPARVSATFDDIYFTFPDGGDIGDFDGDGQLSGFDIDLLSAAVGSGDVIFDLDGNGAVDEEDRRIWVEDVFGTFFGDADLNKEVAFADFLALSSNFSEPGAGPLATSTAAVLSCFRTSYCCPPTMASPPLQLPLCRNPTLQCFFSWDWSA